MRKSTDVFKHNHSKQALLFLSLILLFLTASFAFAQRVTPIDAKGTKQLTGNVVKEGNTAPSAPIQGDIWFDTTDVNNTIPKVWDGNSWEPLSTNGEVGTSLWKNNASSSLTELKTLSNGTTTRPAGTEVVVTDAGKMGIGTTTPAETLTVSGSAQITGSLKDSNGNTGTNGQIFSTTVNGTKWINAPDSGLWENNTSGSRAELKTLSNGTSTRPAGTEVVVTDAGNMGIGTTNPGVKLQVENTGINTAIFRSTDSGARVFFERINDTKDTWLGFRSTGHNGWLIGMDNFRHNFEIFRYNNIDGGTNTSGTTLVATPQGHIGIGTTSPAETLTVNGSARITGTLKDSSGNVGTNGQLLSTTGTGTKWLNAPDSGLWENNASSSRAELKTLSNGTSTRPAGRELVMTDTGRLGIGTTSPAETLTVNGSARITGTLKDSNSSGGTNGQLLSTTGSGTKWLNANEVGLWKNNASSSRTELKTLSNGTSTRPAGRELVMTDTGRLGIGTTSPAETLTVNGSARITGTLKDSNSSGGTNGQLLSTTGSGTKWLNANEVGLWKNNASSSRTELKTLSNGTSTRIAGRELVMTDIGRLGVGTSSPQGKLHISAATSGDAELIIEADTDNNNDDDNPRIVFKQDGGVFASAIGHFGHSNNGSNFLNLANGIDQGGIQFITGANPGYLNGISRMIILPNGNVGIGTTTPSETLTVNGSARITGTLKDSSGSGGTNKQIFSATGSGTKWLNANEVGLWKNNASSFRAELKTLSNGTTTRAAGKELVITDTGRLGVGTTNPQGKLHISAATSGDAELIIEADTDNSGNENDNPIIVFKQDGGVSASAVGHYSHAGSESNFLNIANGISQGGIQLITGSTSGYSNGTSRMVILPNGNVGVGTTSPTAQLEVNGETIIDGAAHNKNAHNAGSSTTIDFKESNFAYTSASAGAFTLNNLKDGGSYTLAVQGNSPGVSSFTASGFTFRSRYGSTSTVANCHSIYSFIVMGNTVYYSLVTGLKTP